jgi:hypothetical protein
VQSLDEPSNLHTPPPMMFFRAVVVPILGKSALLFQVPAQVPWKK